MDNEVLIGLVVGGAGVVLGLLGVIIAVIARVAASHAARDLQGLQQEMAQIQSAKWMKNQELENLLKVRRAMLESIQKLKDSMTGMLQVEKGAMKKEAVYKAVSDDGRVLSKLCEDHAAKLSETERSAVNRAKDAAVETTYQVRSFLDEIDDPADLSSAHRAELSRLRAELSESQQVLRDRIQDRLIHLVLSEGRGE